MSGSWMRWYSSSTWRLNTSAATYSRGAGWVLPVLLTEAEEVQGLALRQLQAQTTPADAADQQALEMVPVTTLARTLGAASRHEVLHTLE